MVGIVNGERFGAVLFVVDDGSLNAVDPEAGNRKKRSVF